MAQPYIYPLTVQTVLPDDYRADESFREDLTVLQEEGFWGVELNIKDPANVRLDDVRGFLGEFGLEMSMFASGLTAKTLGLSLSALDEDVRKRSVSRCKEMIDFVDGTDIGIIMGFLKGTKVDDAEAAKERFRQSLSELAPYVEEKQAILIVEATNRYETSIANSVQEAVDFVAPHRGSGMKVLPDTFHMNIEEADMFTVLASNLEHYISFHISDNNRYFPGLGAIDFEPIIRHLVRIGFDGRLGIEGNLRHSFAEDIRATMRYLRPILRKEGE